MNFLRTKAGPFPIGIWVSLMILFVSGGLFTIVAQALSFFSWDVALALGLQEDARTSESVVERTVGAMSWGEAGADLFVQGTMIILAIAGIFARRGFGLVAGIAQGIFWIYIAILVPMQRFGLYLWGVEPDLSRMQSLGPVVFLLAGVPGAILLVALIANRDYFHRPLARIPLHNNG